LQSCFWKFLEKTQEKQKKTKIAIPSAERAATKTCAIFFIRHFSGAQNLLIQP